jgi:hypothetical protein
MTKSKRPPGALSAHAFPDPKRTANKADFKRDPVNVALTDRRNNAEDKVIMMRLDKEFDAMFGVE